MSKWYQNKFVEIYWNHKKKAWEKPFHMNSEKCPWETLMKQWSLKPPVWEASNQRLTSGLTGACFLVETGDALNASRRLLCGNFSDPLLCWIFRESSTKKRKFHLLLYEFPSTAALKPATNDSKPSFKVPKMSIVVAKRKKPRCLSSTSSTWSNDPRCLLWRVNGSLGGENFDRSVRVSIWNTCGIPHLLWERREKIKGKPYSLFSGLQFSQHLKVCTWNCHNSGNN